MAKGDPGGLYSPMPYTGRVDNPELIEWLMGEYTRVSTALELAIARNIEELNVAPDKPRDGNVAFADGTHWNPGSGRGLYYYRNGAWRFIA